MNANRRRFLTTTSMALAAAAAGRSALFARVSQSAGAGQAGPPAAPPTAFAALRGTIGTFVGQGGTIGYHIGKDGVVVVDAQMAPTAQIALQGIRERAGGRMIDVLVNTHHHGDHTEGNAVFRPAVKRILAHVNVPSLQRAAAAQQAAARPGAPPPEPVVADATFVNTWEEDVGGERLALKYYGAAHTSGDVVVTFAKTDVVHMGDLVFNRRHPYIDRPAGASISNWIKVLEAVAGEHGSDTQYIFGHAGERFPVTGARADLLYQRDYLTALLEHVRRELTAGKPKDEIVKTAAALRGFPDHGPLVPRVLTAAYEELAG
ncbi:MAG TPA: MBL fold metallo-hydrolase [Vicinamibacterales bacterium]|nr:MBL fold metallo-hydrolase [Vicinamibacterales bacterium]HPW21824.1 MBL fold metallo-hydrolase [Vicinamibacterales bacterium]